LLSFCTFLVFLSKLAEILFQETVNHYICIKTRKKKWRCVIISYIMDHKHEGEVSHLAYVKSLSFI